MRPLQREASGHTVSRTFQGPGLQPGLPVSSLPNTQIPEAARKPAVFYNDADGVSHSTAQGSPLGTSKDPLSRVSAWHWGHMGQIILCGGCPGTVGIRTHQRPAAPPHTAS